MGYMKTKPCIALFLFKFICSVSAADSNVEQAVRDQDAQWSKAAESRDLEKLLSFYADDAIVLPAHATIATTKDSIRNIFQKLLSIPGVALGWKPTKVTVAGSGDLAYSTGAHEMQAPDDTGKPSIMCRAGKSRLMETGRSQSISGIPISPCPRLLIKNSVARCVTSLLILVPLTFCAS